MAGGVDTHERQPLLGNNPVTSSRALYDGTDDESALDDRGEEEVGGKEDEEDSGAQKRRCIRNFLIHCVSAMFVLTSYAALQNLQSTLNKDSGVGVVGLTCVFVGLVVSCPLAPVVSRVLGFKWTMALCYFTQGLFAAANFYPKLYTLVPACLLLGLTSGPFWTAQGMFLTTLALQYSQLMDLQPSVIISRFNGIFFMFFQSSQIWGNLISSLVLYNGSDTIYNNGSDVTNDTGNATSCGAQFCNWDAAVSGDSRWEHPAQDTVWMLVGIYLGCCVVGLFLKSCLVDNVKRHSSDDFGEEGLLAVLGSLVVVHCQPLMLLLVPLFIFNGLEQGFLFGDYTSAFVGCQLGIAHVGYTMISFGAANALASLLAGRIQTYTGRVPLLLTAAGINAGLFVYLLEWKPEAGPDWVFYFLPAVWGVADALWQTTTTSMIAVVFAHCRDPAFASFRLWQSVGLVISFAYSYPLCTLPKIYIALGLLAVAMVMYVAMEITNKRFWGQKAYIDLYAPIVE